MKGRRSLLIGTRNPGKARELASLLGDVPFDVTWPAREAVELQVEEPGATFEENAMLKAKAYASASGLLTLCDDSGLEVDALEGRPGVYSARYGGPGATDPERVGCLLRELEKVPPERRGARFRCVIAIAEPEGEVTLFKGVVEGQIAPEPRGSNGFGYDPVFLLPRDGRTTAELSPQEKDRISHRGKAARLAAAALRRLGAGAEEGRNAADLDGNG